jgi:hypothetical protein
MDTPPLDRRTFLRAAGGLGLALFVPLGRADRALAVAVGDDAPRFLTDDELATLRAAVDRFIPADTDPGAVAAGCAEAIDALLAAFEVDPPLIYAGAPWSDRGGANVNHFEDFLPLDPYEEQAWRLRIQGSRGRRELEFNGPVTGFQDTYRAGLAACDEAAGPARFADLPAPMRDAILRSDDPRIQAFVDVAFPHTLEAMYGAPEYGGNRDLIGWDYTGFMGDVQPRGWTDDEVTRRDADGPAAPPPDGTTDDELAALAPLAFPELGFGMLARTDGRLSGLEAEAAAIRRVQHDAVAQRDRIQAAIDAVAAQGDRDGA